MTQPDSQTPNPSPQLDLTLIHLLSDYCYWWRVGGWKRVWSSLIGDSTESFESTGGLYPPPPDSPLSTAGISGFQPPPPILLAIRSSLSGVQPYAPLLVVWEYFPSHYAQVPLRLPGGYGLSICLYHTRVPPRRVFDPLGHSL